MKTLIANEIDAFQHRAKEKAYWATHESAPSELVFEWLSRPNSLLENISWYVRRWPVLKKNEVRRYLRHKWQYLTKEYADDDLWDFDHTNARRMDKYFTHMIERCYGYPSVFETMEEWINILTEIRDGFRAYVIFTTRAIGATSLEFLAEEENDVMRKLDNSFRLMSEWYPRLWD